MCPLQHIEEFLQDVSSKGSFLDGELPIRDCDRDSGQCWRNIVRAVDCWKFVENDGSTFASRRNTIQNPLRGRDIRALRGAK
jgi:hypothetical protein